MSKIEEAISILEREHKKEKIPYSLLSQKYGFNENKLFQWVKTKNIPSVKIAKQIIEKN